MRSDVSIARNTIGLINSVMFRMLSNVPGVSCLCSSQLLSDLSSQLLNRHLRLQHPAHALPPPFLQQLHLPADQSLRGPEVSGPVLQQPFMTRLPDLCLHFASNHNLHHVRCQRGTQASRFRLRPVAFSDRKVSVFSPYVTGPFLRRLISPPRTWSSA